MGKVGKALLLTAALATFGRTSPSDSTPAETCRELVDRIKHSDCAKPVARYLDGATILLGFGLHSSQMTLKRHDSTVALLTGYLTPAPYYAFSLPQSFLGSTRWGWEVSLAYSSSIAVYQSIQRGKKTETADFGTYAALTFASASPSIFFSFGGRDEDPDIYMRLGLGIGLGLGSIRGTAYYTESPGACADTATLYANGGAGKNAIKSTCGLQSFNHFDMGGSTHLFWDWRWHWVYGALDVNSLRLLRGNSLALEPVEAALKLAFIHDL